MSVLGSIGLAAALQLEKSVGPQVALRSFRPLLTDADREVRARACIGAMRCAAALGEHGELEQIATVWSLLGSVSAAVLTELGELFERLSQRGQHGPDLRAARIVAGAEAERNASGPAYYRLARVLDVDREPDDEVLRAYQRAMDLGPQPYDVAAAGRLLEIAAARDVARATELAARMDESALSPSQRLLRARALLAADGKFTRASALSSLEAMAREAAETGDDAVLRAAVAMAAEHADRLGPDLSWVEADRVGATLAQWPDETARSAAVAALTERRTWDATSAAPSAAAATILADGDRAELEAALARVADPLEAAGLRAVAACRRGDEEDARDALMAARRLLEDRVEAPAAVWAAARLGLERSLPPAVALVTALIGCGGAPRGLCSLVPWLRRAGEAELATTALRVAVRQGEAGAKALLAKELVAQGWRVYAEEPERARLLLIEARRLAEAT